VELVEAKTRQASDAQAARGTVYHRLHRLDEAKRILPAVVDGGQGSLDTAYILGRLKADRGHAEVAPPPLEAAPGLFLGRNEARQRLERLNVASK
jgi:hypothetical protein